MNPSDPADAAVPSASGGGGVATRDTDPAVQVRELGFTVGGAVILADIDLTIARGELLAVIGPNGAGKSTLVNMISGVARPTAGQIRLNGRDVTRLSVRHRARAGIGRTFQTSSLFNGLTTVQNVCFAVQSAAAGALNPFRRAGSPAVVAQAIELLERVGMAARSSWPTAALSHGDKRKLELAVAMARRPDVLLLDEPMAGVAMEDVPGAGATDRRPERRRASPSAWWNTTCTWCWAWRTGSRCCTTAGCWPSARRRGDRRRGP